jgi:hypothetical protein
MKLADLVHGYGTTFQVEADPPEQLAAAVGVPLRLFRPEHDDRALLAAGERVWVVHGREDIDAGALDRILDRGRPRVVSAQALGPRDAPTGLALQVREFASEQTWTEPVELGVDDLLVEALRRSRMIGRGTRAEDVPQRLAEWFLFAAVAGPPTMSAAITVGHRDAREPTGMFSLHGRTHSADVEPAEDGTLRVKRVTRLRRSAGQDSQPWRLMHGAISFVDATVAGTLRTATAAELDNLVRGADSYLRRWTEYNAIERRHVLDRARRAGAIRYVSCDRHANGDWRFRLAQELDEPTFRRLDDSRSDDLAAGAQPPHELHATATAQDADRRPRHEFVGRLVNSSYARRTIDLRADQGLWDDRRPPATGYLFVSLAGDDIRLKRRKQARDAIVHGAGAMPQLGLLLEGKAAPIIRHAERVRIPARVLARFPGGRPTDRQLEALLVAMNTPDLAVIQGPPGTGKTDVIAALETWLAEDAGTDRPLAGTVLLTSYQHDAVDNAASRSTVLDLPALRIGGRRSSDEAGTEADAWAATLADTLGADLAERVDGPLVERARELKELVLMYELRPMPPKETVVLLEQVASSGDGLLPAQLRDRLQERADQMRDQMRAPAFAGEELLQRAIRRLRTTTTTFSDDGPLEAGKLLVRLRAAELGTPEDHELLRRAAQREAGDPFDEADLELLDALAALRDRLLDLLADSARRVATPTPTYDHVSRSLLTDAAREASAAVEASRDAVGEIIADLRDTLVNDPRAVAQTLGNYTSVLAATCQQSAGRAMALEKEHGATFDTVIVDEAARANPLDLMIPLTQAARRIVLVGDHRQLPHVLEPEVERELDADVAEATRTALRQSLFERLFVDLDARERTGEPKRVVTLDTQFRMHPVLGDFVSRAFYEPHGTVLKSGLPATAFSVNLKETGHAVAAWVDVPLGRDPEQGAMSKRRPPEAKWIAEHLVGMMDREPRLSFGVVSFYSAQVDELERALLDVGVMVPTDDGGREIAQRWQRGSDHEGRPISRLRVGTVDAFQGREFDVVLLSLTRSSRPVGSTDPLALRRRFGHLMLENRLCVAMSRQKRLLTVVGDAALASDAEGIVAVPALASFLDLCEGEHGVRIRA